MQEKNVIIKPWKEGMFKIALVYPNRYSAMAGLTVQTLYSLWNAHERVICERFFLPDSKIPLPRGHLFQNVLSLENKMPLEAFDLIAFTFSYELDYPHILWFLENAGIPFYRKDREKKSLDNISSDSYPVIIVGGAIIRANPLPILDFMDAIYIGEIEPVNAQFIESWLSNYDNPELRDFQAIKKAFFKDLANIAGFWLPGDPFFENPDKTINHILAHELDRTPHPLAQIKLKGDSVSPSLNSNIAFSDSFFLEVARGCPHICRFCMTGNQVKPYRYRSLENLKEIILSGIKLTDCERIALIGSSVTDHPNFIELAEFILQQGLRLNVPSIRVDKLTPKMAEILRKGGIKTVTIAPETGSDRLRKQLNKHLTNKEILQGVIYLHEAKINALKIYLIIGFPFESTEDIDELIILVEELAKMNFGKRGIKLSINPFIPKAHTPFEVAFEEYFDPSMQNLKKKIKHIKKALQKNSRIEIDFMPLWEAYLQMILALGDEHFSLLIEECYYQGMKPKQWYRYCTDPKNVWQTQIIDYLHTLQKLPFGKRPWNKIIHYISPDWLKSQLERATNC
ncbi:radical SAM protein [Candidatus Harpocratesius sp.]